MESLSVKETARLDVLEAKIEKGRRSFLEVGKALAEIRDQRLWRAEFRSFEAYCEKKWDFAHDRAYQLIAAAGVVAELKSVDHGQHLPSNERQARELSRVDPEYRAEVWRDAVARAPVNEDGEPDVRASDIRAVVDAKVTPAKTEVDPRRSRGDAASLRYGEVARLLRTAKAEMKACREDGDAPHITNGFEHGIDAVLAAVKDGKPFCTCPACDGKGGECELCRGRGWLSREEHGRLPKSQKAKAVEL